MLKRIWNDKVGSKLIVIVIVAIGSWIWSLIVNIPYGELLTDIYNIKVRIVYVLVVILLFYLLQLLWRRYISRKALDPDAEIKKNNQKVANGVLWKYRVVTWGLTRPEIREMTPYCPEHQQPIKMARHSIQAIYTCPIDGCNVLALTNQTKLKLQIESEIEAEYEELSK